MEVNVFLFSFYLVHVHLNIPYNFAQMYTWARCGVKRGWEAILEKVYQDYFLLDYSLWTGKDLYTLPLVEKLVKEVHMQAQYQRRSSYQLYNFV